MLGRRGTAELAQLPTVELLPEELARLIGEAQARIETVGGVDYLDGYNLPPADEEAWNPSPVRVRVTHMVEKGGLWAVWDEEHEVDPNLLTNADIRDVNIRTIATIGHPLFRTWEEVRSDRERNNTVQKAAQDEQRAAGWHGKLKQILFR